MSASGGPKKTKVLKPPAKKSANHADDIDPHALPSVASRPSFLNCTHEEKRTMMTVFYLHLAKAAEVDESKRAWYQNADKTALPPDMFAPEEAESR